MSKPRKNFDKDGFRLHRWNPEDVFDLTNNPKYWKKTILNYEESNVNIKKLESEKEKNV
jgi:hypothetical protein|tara:strand:+ start:1288 stop:1464 length:177 start_codon:yes stop_codon:yes gene_type:complete